MGRRWGKARLLGRYFGEVVLHPYLGFVGNPDGSAPGGKDPVAVDLGFLNNPRNVLQKRSPEKLIVAFFGGSMANILSDQGREVLVDELRGSRRFSGKEVVLVSLGMGGYKQPQQLMALSYILVMGGELDIVVNIDGFNEVALPPAELEPWDIFPLYPRNWAYRVSSLGPELRRVLGRIDYLEGIRKSRARRFSNPIPGPQSLRRGCSGACWTHASKRTLWTPTRACGTRIWSWRTTSSKGRAPGWATESDPYGLMVETWSRGSQQMDRLCRANGIEYYHFLQPNQYLPDSKPLSPEELESAYHQDHKYRPGVVAGYPLLQIAGRASAGWGGIPRFDGTVSGDRRHALCRRLLSRQPRGQ